MRRIVLAITLAVCLLTGSVSVLIAPWTFAAAATGNGLRGEYFNDTTLTTLALSRIDPTVNFNWQTGAPASGLRSDQFTVRWTGQVLPRFSQAYTFRVTADDGARLWIDGQLVIDAWSQ